MADGEPHYSDIFAAPGSQTPVEFNCPEWVGVVSREAGGFATPEAEVLRLESEEMPPGMSQAWARDGGWAAFGTRIRAVAAALGGEVILETWRGVVTGNERHAVTWKGPEVDI